MIESAAAPCDGLVLLDKPLGLSSQHASLRLRRWAGALRAGHVGSLDPLATGMLPVCLGEATKVADLLLDSKKSYRFVVALGERSSTGDREGEIIERRAVPQLDANAVVNLLTQWQGPQSQIPPMYSAVKHGGQPLYRLARQGKSVERAPRAIEIFAVELLAQTPTQLELRVVCSKGTYVRVLAEDLAEALGTCGHVASLRREWVSPFQTQRMLQLDPVRPWEAGALLPARVALQDHAALELDADQLRRLQQGQPVPWSAASSTRPARAGEYCVRDATARYFGLATLGEDAALRPRRMFVRPW
jgi:tRNA pseudouridine55 synthase